jgi:hypothetical protein
MEGVMFVAEGSKGREDEGWRLREASQWYHHWTRSLRRQGDAGKSEVGRGRAIWRLHARAAETEEVLMISGMGSHFTCMLGKTGCCSRRLERTIRRRRLWALTRQYMRLRVTIDPDTNGKVLGLHSVEARSTAGKQDG